MRTALLLAIAALAGCAANTPKKKTISFDEEPSAPSNGTCPTLGTEQPLAESKACSTGDADACESDCHAGRAYGCFAMAQLYEQHGDAPHTAKFYRRACQLGAPIACTNFGAMAFTGKQKLAPACALSLFEAACTAGEPFGCAMVGRTYAEGYGVTPDPERARKVLDAACTELGGFPCFVLGAYLRKGALGEPDDEAAHRAFERACATKFKPACSEVDATTTTGGGTKL